MGLLILELQQSAEECGGLSEARWNEQEQGRAKSLLTAQSQWQALCYAQNPLLPVIRPVLFP